MVPDKYYPLLSKIESSNNPNAKASTSSASGLYQFTRGTWEGLGYNWKDVFNVSLQNQAIRTLTTQNANILAKQGIAINCASLYAAHFLGAATACYALKAHDNVKMIDLVPNAVKANKFMQNMTVADFKGWLLVKTGDRI